MNRIKYIYPLLYVTCVTLANLTASFIIKIILTDFSGTSNTVLLTFALGTLFFGFIFTLRDLIHVYLGRKAAYISIGLALTINLLLSAFGAVPIRIIVASMLAMFLSESLDTEVFHRLKQNSWTLRVLSSNIVSIPIDTILFTCIAFFGIWPNEVIMSVILGEIVIKFVTSAVLILVYHK